MKKNIVNAVVALATLVAMPMYAQEFTWNETTHDFGTIDEAVRKAEQLKKEASL